MKQEQSLWSIITSVLRAAPTRTKVFVTLMPVLLILLTVSVVMDLVGSHQPTASVQVWSLILGNAGLLLWSLAAVLHAASESKSRRRATASSANDLFRRIWTSCLQFTARLYGEGEVRQLHNIVLVLPIISVTAGVLLAAATGILLPSITDSPLLLLPIFMYAIFVAMAVRTVSDTVRFLFRSNWFPRSGSFTGVGAGSTEESFPSITSAGVESLMRISSGTSISTPA